MIRDLNLNDLVQLEKHAQFPLTNLSNKPMVLQKTFEDDKGIVGSLLVNRTLEVAIILDDRSLRDKVKFLKQIPALLCRELIPLGYRDAHVFTENAEYAEILIKHFGFEHAVGIALVKRV